MSPMEYQISAPASHAAVVIFRNFTLREIGRVEATKDNVAKVIDICTQMFRLVPALRAVVRSTSWLQRDELRAGLDRLREAVLGLSAACKRTPSFADNALTPRGYSVSAPALHAAKVLMQYYQFMAAGTIRPTERNLAVLIDVCTDVFRVAAIAERLAASRLWVGKDELPARMEDIREALRAAELVHNRIPTRASGSGVVVHKARQVEIKLTGDQLHTRMVIAREVSAARTVEEQQAVLVKAGVVRYGA
jgi:hypothetical protein